MSCSTIKPIVYVDGFSGAGGFAVGFMKAGLQFSQHYYSEIDPHAIALYKYKFNSAHHVGNIKTIRSGSIKHKPNIFTFGCPCQDISIAGKREGLHGSRSSLFFEGIEFIKENLPEVFVFENVENLLYSNEGKDFETVVREFANIGLYSCEWQLLDTSWILPQNRKRVYVVGHLTGSSTPGIFPYTPSGQDIDRGKPTRSRSGNISALRWVRSNQGKQARTQAFKEGKDYTPFNKGHRKLEVNPRNVVGCITSNQNKDSLILDRGRIRRLTTIECERLQGFPDDWTKHGEYDGQVIEIAMTQRYKLMGNAVTTDFPEYIGKKIIELNRHKSWLSSNELKL